MRKMNKRVAAAAVTGGRVVRSAGEDTGSYNVCEV
jgi:hypothetical protein